MTSLSLSRTAHSKARRGALANHTRSIATCIAVMVIAAAGYAAYSHSHRVDATEAQEIRETAINAIFESDYTITVSPGKVNIVDLTDPDEGDYSALLPKTSNKETAQDLASKLHEAAPYNQAGENYTVYVASNVGDYAEKPGVIAVYAQKGEQLWIGVKESNNQKFSFMATGSKITVTDDPKYVASEDGRKAEHRAKVIS